MRKEEFELSSARFLEIKERLKELKLESSSLREELIPFITENGEGEENKRIFLQEEEGVKWQVSILEKVKYNEDLAIEKIVGLEKKARGKKKELLGDLLIPSVIIDKEKLLANKDKFPEVVSAWMEVKEETRLNSWYLSKLKCKSCGASIKRGDKFCHECGAKQAK